MRESSYKLHFAADIVGFISL